MTMKRNPLPPAFNARHRALRELIASGRTTAAMGASDALSARQIEAAGFDCVYIGSYATAASRLALPDTGLLSLQDMVGQARGIVDAVNIPVIADAEGGFNDAANLWRTVRDFERAGVSAIHIEDHAYGKHAEVPQRLHPIETVASRIRAAVDAREDPDFMIVARSDAYWVSQDLDETVARLNAYAEAGADMVFPTMLPPPRQGRRPPQAPPSSCTTAFRSWCSIRQCNRPWRPFAAAATPAPYQACARTSRSSSSSSAMPSSPSAHASTAQGDTIRNAQASTTSRNKLPRKRISALPRKAAI